MYYFGCFVNDLYMPCFKILQKSINYYMKDKAHIVVYNFDKLSNENTQYILNTKMCEIIDVPIEIKQKKNYWVGCAWRPIILKHLQSKYNSMLFIDIDMVILDDLSDIFENIEKGNFVGSNEWTYDTLHHQELQKKEIDKLNDDIFHLVQKRYDKPIPIYNGGLIGINFNVHKDLIEKWGESFEWFDTPNGLTNDQFILSFLIQFTNHSIINLDAKYYMNTWHNHNTPRKIIGFSNGKMCLYNNNDIVNKIRVYHFTGDIGMRIDERPYVTWRYYHFSGEYKDDLHELKFYSRDELREMSIKLWEEHHSSPALIICKYMENL